MARDRAAFRLLYDELIDRVYAYVRSRTSTTADATDVTQDAFIDLFAALERFEYKSIGQFYAFVFTITRRKLGRYYDTKKRDFENRVELPDDSILPSDITTDTEVTDTVSRALSTLPEVVREIIVLHHWSRYTFGEIAELLDMTESAVRVRHHRALKELAALLEPHHEGL